MRANFFILASCFIISSCFKKDGSHQIRRSGSQVHQKKATEMADKKYIDILHGESLEEKARVLMDESFSLEFVGSVQNLKNERLVIGTLGSKDIELIWNHMKAVLEVNVNCSQLGKKTLFAHDHGPGQVNILDGKAHNIRIIVENWQMILYVNQLHQNNLDISDCAANLFSDQTMGDIIDDPASGFILSAIETEIPSSTPNITTEISATSLDSSIYNSSEVNRPEMNGGMTEESAGNTETEDSPRGNEVSDTENGPGEEVSDTENGPGEEVSDTENGPGEEVSDIENGPGEEVADTVNGPGEEVSDTENDPDEEVTEPGSIYLRQSGNIDYSDQTEWMQDVNFVCANSHFLVSEYSVHDDIYEDRKFKFGCIKLKSSNENEVIWKNRTNPEVFANDFDSPVNFYCPENTFIVGQKSVFDLNRGDRRFKYYCAEMYEKQGSDEIRLAPDSCTHDSDYANAYDHPVRFSTPEGKLLVGVHSVHNNEYEDRKYRFHYCDVKKMEQVEDNSIQRITTTLGDTDPEFGGYVNGYDENVDFRCPTGMVQVGEYSEHNDDREDRKFKFQCKKLNAEDNLGNTYQVKKTDCGWSGTVNEWDDLVDYTCPNSKFLVGHRSIHDNDREDRKFKFRCCNLRIDELNLQLNKFDCKNPSNFINEYDESVLFNTNGQRIMTGVYSIHSNYHEDRRFKFRSCKAGWQR